MESSNSTVMSATAATDQQQLLVDPNLEPQMRNRCNTWPLRPIIDPPSAHDSESNPPTESVIKEEPEDFLQTELDDETPPQHSLSGGPDGSGANISNQLGINNSSELGSQGDLNAKKQSARKNAWGNLSYADLITKAIQSSPEKRLTLSQIYDWMVQNVSYFRDKGDSNSSAGWKNSIRHNLSLHNRFMRIQNEGAGKSSWWVINPDAKHGGKAPRRPRGGSMDSSKSMGMKASRDRAMKKVRELKNKGLLNKDGTSPVSPANDFTLSPGDSTAYRDRASSFASSIGGRRSPIHDDILDAKLSPWGSENRLDTDYQMDTKLPDSMDLLGLTFPDLQTGSLLNELEDISEPYNESGTGNMTPHGSFLGKPYTSYLQSTESTGGYPPPPYPDPNTEQQAFNKQNMSAGSVSQQPLYNKDPMMANYNPNNGNNNNHRPQFPGGYTNGILPSQTMAQQHGRLPQPRMSQAQQRVLPNSIRAALGSNPPATRANQISQSLKDSAPILTSQLLEYQSSTQQQTMFSQGQGPQASRQQQPMAFTQYPASTEQQPGFQYGSTPVNSSQNSNSYFPNDIDLENMPELLPCDVDEIIQQELRMDGGQLDFTGFEGYTSNQQQQQTPSSQSGNGNMSIGLS